VPLDGKVPPVAKEEFLGIVFHQVNFSPDFLSFTWRQAADVLMESWPSAQFRLLRRGVG